jgi:hypothetical protein
LFSFSQPSGFAGAAAEIRRGRCHTLGNIALRVA